MLDCTYSPFPKITSILTLPPLPLWSSFSELSEVLTPRPQLSLIHNSHIVLFFFLSQPRDFGQFLSRSHTAESNGSVRLPSFPVEVMEMNLLPSLFRSLAEFSSTWLLDQGLHFLTGCALGSFSAPRGQSPSLAHGPHQSQQWQGRSFSLFFII